MESASLTSTLYFYTHRCADIKNTYQYRIAFLVQFLYVKCGILDSLVVMKLEV